MAIHNCATIFVSAALLIVYHFTLTCARQPSRRADILESNEIKKNITKMLIDTPDFENTYIAHEGLALALRRLFGNKMSIFPLFKVSMKIDRNPVKIPWTYGKVNEDVKTYKMRKPRFRAGKNKKQTREKPTEKFDINKNTVLAPEVDSKTFSLQLSLDK